jgi:hypothetical protein
MTQRWRKFVAITFLLWALTDLLVPGVCKAETPTLQAESSVASVTSVSSAKSSSEHESAPLSNDEDCFCCCSHVTPAQIPAVVALQKTHQDRTPVAVESPKDFAFAFYHPPRS